MAKQKRYVRTKKKFKSARAAWADIHRNTGLNPEKIKAKHSKKSYIFIIK